MADVNKGVAYTCNHCKSPLRITSRPSGNYYETDKGSSFTQYGTCPKCLAAYKANVQVEMIRPPLEDLAVL
jgi:hypothetical protein